MDNFTIFFSTSAVNVHSESLLVRKASENFNRLYYTVYFNKSKSATSSLFLEWHYLNKHFAKQVHCCTFSVPQGLSRSVKTMFRFRINF